MTTEEFDLVVEIVRAVNDEERRLRQYGEDSMIGQRLRTMVDPKLRALRLKCEESR